MSELVYKKYFLGALDEASSAQIELRVVEDADFAAEIAAVEENLIEAYLENALSSAEASLFHKNYLSTEERVKNVEMTALMKRYAGERAIPAVEIGDTNDHARRGLFRGFGSFHLGVRLATATAALVFAIAGIWFVLRSRPDNELIALQKRYEQINQTPNSIPTDTNLSELVFLGGNLRSSGSLAELRLADLTENVRFRIALPAQTDEGTGYVVTVFRNSKEVFRQNDIRPVAGSPSPEIRFLLPRQIFTAGSYRVQLSREKQPEIDYYFVVKQ